MQTRKQQIHEQAAGVASKQARSSQQARSPASQKAQSANIHKNWILRQT